jgi:hypothetical protein
VGATARGTSQGKVGEDMTPTDLRARRLRLALSQTRLAKYFGVGQPYISYAETVEGYARPWYDLGLRCIEYEERVRKLPRKWTKPPKATDAKAVQPPDDGTLT